MPAWPRGCGAPLGFIPGDMALNDAAGGRRTARWGSRPRGRTRSGGAASTPRRWAATGWCRPEAEDPRCPACRLNRNLADMNVPANRAKWQALECAKRRLLYALRRFGVPIASQKEGETRGLAFDFLEGTPRGAGDDRACQRAHHHQHRRGRLRRARAAAAGAGRALPDAARAHAARGRALLLGPARAGGGRLEECRALFGDERGSYAEALERTTSTARRRAGRRATSAPMRRCIPGRTSPRPGRTTCTWSTRSTPAASFGLSVNPRVGEDPRNAAVIDFDPYRPPDFASLARAWLPLTAAVNSLNRSMGQPDLYPFDPSPGVLAKVALHPRTSASAERGTGRNLRRLTPPPAARRRIYLHVFTCQNCGQLLHFENAFACAAA